MESEKTHGTDLFAECWFLEKRKWPLRAAFKALEQRETVAVLVPTTIFAFQHQETLQNGWKKCQ